jgi:hypothetical protein
MIFGDAPDMTPEEHRRLGDAADALFVSVSCWPPTAVLEDAASSHVT